MAHQYRKAWLARFPSELWPAEEEETEEGKNLPKAKGWKQASLYEPAWRRGLGDERR